MKKWMMILTCLFISVGLTFAQTTAISGTVVDDTGEAVIGASVVVKGTTVGTVTNVDGEFTISVPAGKNMLVFSLIGMKNQESQAKQGMRVVMTADSEILDEVMVVAYGTAKKSTFTGSASVIKADAIEKIPATSFEKALQGASPGLQIASVSGQPGSQTTVRIRGIGSITGNSNPLYVIDGTPIFTSNISKVANNDPDFGSTYGTTSNPLASLNPNDIASVTVLKDAAAASLYGSRAANGVIIITTKQGLAGEAKIDFRSQFGISKIMNNGYNLMNGSEIYKHYWQGYKNQNIAAGKTPAEAAALANTSVASLFSRNPYNVAQPLDVDGNLVNGAQLMIDNSWKDALYREAASQQYDLSISGGNAANKYFISLGYLNQDAIVKGSGFERYSGRINVDSQVKKWMKAGINSTFSIAEQNTPMGGAIAGSPMYTALNYPNIVPIYNYDKDFKLQYDEKGNVLYNFKNPVNADYNAVALDGKDIFLTKTYRALVNPWVDFKFIDGLSWRTSVSADYINLDETRWSNREFGSGVGVNGRLSKYASWQLNLMFSTLASYDFSINTDHHFNVLAGFEAAKERYNFQHAHGVEFPPFDLIELNVAAKPQQVNSATDKDHMLSYLGRLNYDYKGKYYGSLSVRRDGSSRMGINSKYGTFWSYGASWRMTEESFMNETKSWLHDLKVRGSFGTSGNKNTKGKYDALGLYEAGYKYNGRPGVIHSQWPNDNLSWESAVNLNLGLDFNIKGRISGSIEYYHKASKDLILERPLAPSTGMDDKVENIGKMVNKGIEFELRSLNIQTRDLQWETSFNLTHNVNKITSFPEEQEISGNKIWTKGYSVYEFYMQEWAGVNPETGAPRWYKDILDANEKPTGERELTEEYSKATRYKQGSSLPNIYGGVNNTINYKGFDLSFLFTYSFGGKVYDPNLNNLLSDGNVNGRNLVKEALNAWTPNNKNTDIPVFRPKNTSNSHLMSTRYLFDANQIKFRNISLGYTVPRSFTKKYAVDNLRLYASIDNVAIWNLDGKFLGYDVEQGGVSGVLDSGGVILPSRTFLFGLSVTF